MNIKKAQEAIKRFKENLVKEVYLEFPNTFWHRSKHEVESPYDKKFREKDIHTKARPI